ncbi:MAG: ArdC family protein [Gammaproteobacteria bacterium]
MQVQQLYAEITARIIEGLEQGVKPWQRGWDADVPLTLPRNAFTGKEYRGSNVLWLWCAREQCGFSAHVWLTYRQAQELLAKQAEARGVTVVKHHSRRGGTYFTDAQGQPLGGVRRGAKAAHCVRYVVKEGDEEESSEHEDRRIIPCAFTVFNLDQVEGIEREAVPPAWEELDAAERLIAQANQSGEVAFYEEGVRAYYSRTQDCIVMPPRGRFSEQYDWYATVLHELVHATGAPQRLNRTAGVHGSPEYAFEELVADLGAAFLCARFGIKGNHTTHESYIASWLEVLNRDKLAVIRAARLAEEAVTYLLDRYGATEH